jgi:hypothetical protein
MSDLAVRSCRAGLLVLAWLVAAPAEAQRIPAAAAVDTVRPAELVLLPGQTIALDLYGRRLRQARGVLVERNRTTTDDVTGRLDCRSPSSACCRSRSRGAPAPPATGCSSPTPTASRCSRCRSGCSSPCLRVARSRTGW